MSLDGREGWEELGGGEGGTCIQMILYEKTSIFNKKENINYKIINL